MISAVKPCRYFSSSCAKYGEIVIHYVSPFIVRDAGKQHSCTGEPQRKVTIVQHSPLKPCCSHGQEEPIFNQILGVWDNTAQRNLSCSMSRFSQYLQKTWGRLVPHLASPKSLLQAVSKVLESAAAPDISQGIPYAFITYSTETLHM